MAMKLKTILLASLALVTLVACTSVPPASEIPASIANATTAADHQRIADHFAQKAASYDAEAVWHERAALSYSSEAAPTYSGRSKRDPSAMIAHCRKLREQFVNSAIDARALEQAHRQLAASVGE
jgi:cytochrome c556